MLRWLIRRKIDAFEDRYRYDASYLRTLLAADPRAVMAMGRVSALDDYRRDIPPAPWFAARVTASMVADCGPCTQLAVDMAREAGVDDGVLRAVVASDDDALPDDVALAARFARAVLARSAELDDLRTEVVGRWGDRGLASLAFGVAVAAVYPTVKAALGHAQACMRVRVGEVDVAPTKG
ncbi:MAG: hypothetical protein H6704_28175 [Myxococcales bacterium]|nr:hypothetical protein [Myxococcales bacterium]